MGAKPALALAVFAIAAAATVFTLSPDLVVVAEGRAIALATLLQKHTATKRASAKRLASSSAT